MPVYEYKAIDAASRASTGIVDAESPRAARAKLRKQGVFPTSVEVQQPGRSTRGKGLSVQVDFSRVMQRVSSADVSVMTSQLSTLLGASVPLVESLAAVAEQTEKPGLKVILTNVREKVNEGISLADALRAHPKVFDTLYVSMVAAGEQSGALDIVLKRLAAHTENMLRLRQKVIAALVYPVLMTFVGASLLTLIFTVVVPRVRKLFDSFGQTLPLITRVMLSASDIVTHYWWLVLLFIALAIYVFRRWVKTEKGHNQWHRFLLKVPQLGRIVRTIAVARFCRTSATLLASGVPIITALQIVKGVVGNVVLAEAIEAATRNIREGQSISAPLKASGQFPALVTHMIDIGERTGELEPMLDKVADSYDSEVSRTLEAATALLEPLIIMFMGGTIGFFAVALLLPMLQMSRFATGG